MHGTLTRVLFAGGLLLGGGTVVAADGAADVKADERRLEAAGVKQDGEALLKFFRQRTLTDEERDKVRALVRQLGDETFKVREHAVAELVARGPIAVELLKEALKDPDLEVIRRAERCLQRILEKDYPVEVAPAAARLLAHRKPAGTVEVLLAYLPFADNDDLADEIRTSLVALAVRGGKTDPALVTALTDKLALRRAAAGEVLCRANAADQKPAVRKLLQDPQPEVRLRVAMALTYARERDAVPVMIELLPRLSQVQAWQVEDVLLRLAEGRNPPEVSLGADEASRGKARDAWTGWWKKNGEATDLARLKATPQLLGYTLVVLLDEGKVMELGKDNQVRWQVDKLNFPLDAQVLPGERVLVAEYYARKVTERNHKGKVLWEIDANGPLVAQRLPNGNTFIATDSQLYEVDRNHKEVFSLLLPAGERVMKAVRLNNGETACLTSEGRLVRLDASGKELHGFPVLLGTKLFGGRIHMMPNGRVLIPHNAENKVVEYDVNGKEVWKVNIEQPVAAVRLPNGNTLVTTMTQNRAVEFDRAGNEVWEYRTNTRVTRAFRR
jgi:HEAT repeat protein